VDGADKTMLNGVDKRAMVKAVTATTVTLDLDTVGKTLTSTAAMTLTPYFAFTKAADATLSNFTLKKRATGGAACNTTDDIFKLVTHVYYVRSYSVTAGDGIPTLMRRTFRVVSGAPQFDASEALLEGVEGLRVELGLDKTSKSGATLTADTNATTGFDAAVNWASSTSHVTPTNRGDGNPEATNFVQCTGSAHKFNGAAPHALSATGSITVPAYTCSAFDLMNAVVAKVYVLVRATSKTPSYTDARTYPLGRVLASIPLGATSGTCDATQCDFTLGPYNDNYKRHVYTATVRLMNVAMRRDVPP
jgi:type IV pilus assembly protein PilW